jgi:hypothetical protein
VDAAARFLYLHVPKTGGVSFRSVLENGFAAGEVLHVSDTRGFADTPPAALARYRFVHGHFTFDQIAHLDGFVKIVTLRDPVERCLSTYDFWRAQDPQAPHWTAGSRKQIVAAQALALPDLCTHPDHEIAGHFNDYQARMLSIHLALHTPMTERYFERALAQLATIDFVALTADLDLATLLLCLRFGLYPPDVPARLNVSRERSDASAEVRAVLAAHNTFDRRLIDILGARGVLRLAGVDERTLPPDCHR